MEFLDFKMLIIVECDIQSNQCQRPPVYSGRPEPCTNDIITINISSYNDHL